MSTWWLKKKINGFTVFNVFCSKQQETKKPHGSDDVWKCGNLGGCQYNIDNLKEQKQALPEVNISPLLELFVTFPETF